MSDAEEEINEDYSDEILEDSEEDVEFLESSEEDSEEKPDGFKKIGLYKIRLTNPITEKNRLKDARRIVIRVVPPEERITSEIIQLPEMVEAVGIRCSEIENGSPVFAEDVTGYSNPIDRARKEFFERRSPLILQRELERRPGFRLVEEWKVRDMVFPMTQREILSITKKKEAEIDVKIRKGNV